MNINKATGPQPTGRKWNFKQGTTIYIHPDLTPIGQLDKDIQLDELSWDTEDGYIYYKENEQGYGLYLKAKDGKLTGIKNNSFLYRGEYETTYKIRPIAVILVTVLIIFAIIIYKKKH